MYLLAFHGFLRIGEIVVSSVRKSYVVLQVDQVTVNQSECVIVFHSYKHYQGHPVSLVISPSADADFCSVKYMQRYSCYEVRLQGRCLFFQVDLLLPGLSSLRTLTFRNLDFFKQNCACIYFKGILFHYY